MTGPSQRVRDNFAAVQSARDSAPMPRGYELVWEGTILRNGWEMDNRLWVIEGPGGRFIGTTSHNSACLMDLAELDTIIAEHEYALTGLKFAKRAIA